MINLKEKPFCKLGSMSDRYAFTPEEVAKGERFLG